MKNLRNITALLLVLTGIIHISLFFEMLQAHSSFLLLLLGILYTIAGTLIYRSMGYIAISGIVVPLCGIFTGLFVLGPSYMDKPLNLLLLLLDMVIVVLCVILLLKREPET